MDLLQTYFSSQELLDEILLCILHPIIITDLEGQVIFASPVVEKVLGFKSDEIKGKNLSIVFTPEDMTYLYPNLLYLSQKKKLFEGELMLVRKNKTRFLAFMIFRPYFDPRQSKPIIIICIQDIDKQKQLEKSFKGTHYEDLVRVANGIAHELRNPLMSIGGFANRLYKSCRANPDHDKYYDYINNNLIKIEDLVKKVEIFARLPKPCFTQESIRELIEKALRPYLQQIEERNIDLNISIDAVILFVDTGLFIRAFSILIDNALDALSEGGKILIHSETEHNQCKIYVTDTGSGISPEDIPYIFNPFFSTKPDGAGIDLAVVKRIMNIHGGHVAVTSKQGEGTTFSLLFPLERRRSIRISSLGDAEGGIGEK